MATQVCYFCGDQVDLDDPTIYHEVKVWVHGPKRDGAVLRNATLQVAHAECISLEKAGQAADQERLF